MWFAKGAFVDADVRRRICSFFPLEEAGIDYFPAVRSVKHPGTVTSKEFFAKRSWNLSRNGGGR